MSLERQDVRFKLDADAHERLKLVVEHDDVTMGEWCERVILLALHQRVTEAEKAYSLFQRLSSVGVSGSSRERSGTAGNDRESVAAVSR